jgi:hypothetical protein
VDWKRIIPEHALDSPIVKVLGCLLALFLQETDVKNAELGFGFQVPAGYQPVTPLPKGLDYGWRRALPSGQEGALALTVVVLPGALGRDAGDVNVTRGNLAKKHPTVTFDLRTLRWRDLDLVAVVREIDIPGVGPGISWTIQVPTAPRAIQFAMIGPLAWIIHTPR